VSVNACVWCGADVDLGDGFRAYEPAGERRATFCRLEHLIPWGIQGARWDEATGNEGEAPVELDECSHCGAALGGKKVLLVRHRGEHRIGDAFCSTDHMVAWAKAGGRWQ
jgi:hypothetical protein